ncbi:phosphate ABC transporter substrate-binding protein [Halobacteriales archaeon QS_1_68_20]|nr:MAG: phosphate ABC transporter substrate-binding protein [Halobacteriales archaeon QS_1_68_20]
MVDRRKFLKGASVASTIGLTGLSGCLGGGGGDDNDDNTDDNSTPEPYGDGALDFYMSPSEPQDLMLSQYGPVKEYLSDEVHETELTYAQNYTAVLEAMGSGTGDVAETGPFAAALGVNEGRADVILQRFAYGSWEYTSVIVTQSDSDISSLQDLEGKTIAFADRLSASGGLFPLYMLKEAGLSIGDLPTGSDANADFSANFAGGHAPAFEALNAGQVDAAGVGQFITVAESGTDNYKEGIEPVEETSGIPRAPIVVSPDLSDDEAQAVTDAFVNAPDDVYLGEDGEADTDDDLWFSDVREAGVDTYQPVIDVATELGISLDELES